MSIFSRATLIATLVLSLSSVEGKGGKTNGVEFVEGGSEDLPLNSVTDGEGKPPGRGQAKKMKAKGGGPRPVQGGGQTPRRRSEFDMKDFVGTDMSSLKELTVQFFDGEMDLDYNTQPCKRNAGSDKKSLCGKLSGGTGGEITLVQEAEGSVTGSATTHDTVYQFHVGSDGMGQVTETLVADFPDEADPEDPPHEESSVRFLRDQGAIKGDGIRRLNVDSGSVIDVLVVYTQEAEAEEGGASAMTGLIDLAIQEANEAYANSAVDLQLNLVHAYKDTSYSESSGGGSFSTILNQLTNTADGHLDSAHSLREQYAADLVALIVSRDAGGSCGIAWLHGYGSQYGMSVSRADCATGYYSFVHEIGHNAGCQHDMGNAPAGMEPSYAYRTPNSAYRSIMAYSPGTRILLFSNPNVSAGGVSSFGSSAENNAQTLTTNKVSVAQYRYSGNRNSSPTPAPTPAPVVKPTASPPTTPSSIQTTYAAQWFHYGNMFNVRASGSSNVKVTSMDVHLYTTSTVEVRVYTQPQSYLNDPWWSWQFVGSAWVQGGGYGVPVSLPSTLFGSGLTISTGTDRGFLVVTPAKVLLFSNNPGGGEGTYWANDGKVSISNGRYTNWNDSPTLPVNSAVYTYYWNGAIKYVVV